MRASALSPVGMPLLNSSQIELCKWLGFLAMIADHANKLLFDGSMVGWAEFGRLAFPLFAFALSAGLSGSARAGVDRVALKLLLWGGISTLVTMPVWGGFRLNIFYTLAAGVLVGQFVWDLLQPSDRESISFDRTCVVLASILLSIFMEYQLVGVFMVAVTFVAYRAQSLLALAWWVISVGLLLLENYNNWSTAAVLVLAVLQFVQLRVPRIRGVFYWLYPSHLAVLGFAGWVLGTLPWQTIPA